MRTTRGLLAAVLIAWACGDDDAVSGGDGGARDATPRDLGGRETSTNDDLGAPADAGVDPVDGAPLDAASELDTSAPSDAGDDRDADTTERDRLMYVSVGGDSRVAVLVLGADGSMRPRADLDVPLRANPGPMAYARIARRIYVGAGRTIVSIALDPEGRPGILGETGMLAGSPVYVAVARDDSLLVSAYFGGDELRVHDISGGPPHEERDRFDTSDEPHAALVAPNGRVYVPHRNGNTTRWFDVSSSGELTAAGELAAEAGAGPRHIAFSPDGAFAYVVNEYADSVSAHTVGTDGSLARFQTITTLPAGFDGSANTCADVHVTPDGRFLYASNRGHDSLAMYTIEADGSLAALGTVPTEARPRELDVSPDGHYVVAAGQDSGSLQSYRIEPDGTLRSVARHAVGDGLLWVIID